LAANNLCNVDEKEDTNDKKTALHKKNIQLDIEGPCDPWTPTFEMKRSMSRGEFADLAEPNSNNGPETYWMAVHIVYVLV
jgi:hypothetical protein